MDCTFVGRNGADFEIYKTSLLYNVHFGGFPPVFVHFFLVAETAEYYYYYIPGREAWTLWMGTFL